VIEGKSMREPSAVSPTDGAAFALVRNTIREVFPDAIVAPALVLGGTDARYYGVVTSNVYRFVPFRFGPTDLTRVHGIDERIAVDSFVDGIRFYVRLLQSGAGAPTQQ
jgi:carboxypeptidase PM20D1